jgi:solute carrier family 6 noradrenalin transporter-like protein 2
MKVFSSCRNYIVLLLLMLQNLCSLLQMGGMECVITGLMDEFHSFFHGRRFAREIFTLGAATVSFSVALINVTPVGTIISLYGCTCLHI